MINIFFKSKIFSMIVIKKLSKKKIIQKPKTKKWEKQINQKNLQK